MANKKTKKLKNKKDSIFWKTSTWVFVYSIACFITMVLQALIALCIKYNFTFKNIVFSDLINGSLMLPISNMGWLWCSICAVYAGVDRASYAIKTSQLESGKLDIGDPKSLRKIIIIAGVLFFIAVICNGFADADFDLNSWSSAFGSSILLYVGGMKAIKSVKYVNGKLDSDNDGIADEDQAVDENGNLIKGQEKTFEEKLEASNKKLEAFDIKKQEEFNTTNDFEGFEK